MSLATIAFMAGVFMGLLVALVLMVIEAVVYLKNGATFSQVLVKEVSVKSKGSGVYYPPEDEEETVEPIPSLEPEE